MTLDTPVENVPTWTILLSQLPAPSSINNTTGTGYHVTVDGYGTNGVGPTGAVGGIDYRRRLAENYIGILGSLDDQDKFLFGAPDGLPQNLYQIDFDSPNHSNRYDFNVFKDNALPNEGTVGPGDSGGPLILDKTFSKPTVIAVLPGATGSTTGSRVAPTAPPLSISRYICSGTISPLPIRIPMSARWRATGRGRTRRIG